MENTNKNLALTLGDHVLRMVELYRSREGEQPVSLYFGDALGPVMIKVERVGELTDEKSSELIRHLEERDAFYIEQVKKRQALEERKRNDYRPGDVFRHIPSGKQYYYTGSNWNECQPGRMSIKTDLLIDTMDRDYIYVCCFIPEFQSH